MTVPKAVMYKVVSWQTATGSVVSETVTVLVQVLLLPFTSVTVSVTVLGPTLAQVNVVGVADSEAMLQLSELPLFTSAAVMATEPPPPRMTVMFWQTATGSVESATVTVLVQVLLLPFTSVTVRVTGLAPTLAQVKELVEGVRLAMAQLSVLPLLMSALVMVAAPDPLR